VQTFFDQARTPLNKTLDNAQKFSEALARNSSGIDKFLESVSDLSTTVKSVSGKLDSTLTSADDILKAVDSEKVGKIIDDTASVTARLNKASEKFDDIANTVDETVHTLNDTALRMQDTLAGIDKVTGAVDPERVSSAITNIDQASRDAKVIAQDFAKVSEKVGRRAEDIDQIIANARQISEQLNEASQQVEGVLKKVDSFLGAGNGEDLFAQASDTLKAYRELADTLNAKMGTITDGLARFSGQGLRDVEALVRDTRRSVNRIEEAVSDLQRNPQRIISGGEGDVRRYDSRVRR
jgi:phospholipid/cholesterol/gamma-HCH transport system substrate-binding protein